MKPASFSIRSVGFVPALTGVRAVAALFVVALHTQQNLLAEIFTYLPFVKHGYLGVDFFFLLSGFIITHVYLRNLERPAAKAIVIFLWHRFIRLYPVHVCVLAALVLARYLAVAHGVTFNNPDVWRLSDIPWHLTLMHAWGFVYAGGWNPPSWSISAEWFAYLLFPLLAVSLHAIRDRLLALLISASCLAATAAVFHLNNWDLGGSWVGVPALIRVTGEFACGAFIRRTLDADARFAIPSWAGDAAGIAATALFLVGASLTVPDFVLVALLAVMILAAATARNLFSRALSNRPMVWLGEISYSIYMVHFPVLILLHRALSALRFETWNEFGRVFAVAGAIAVVIASAAMLFYLVESPVRARLRNVLGMIAAPYERRP